LKQKH